MKKIVSLSILFLFLSSCQVINFKSSSSIDDNDSFSSSNNQEKETSSSEKIESKESSSSKIESDESSSDFESESSSSEEDSKSSSSSSQEDNSNKDYFPYSEDGYYRVAPTFVTSSTVALYNLDGSIYKTIRKSTLEDESTWYIDPLDLAFYYSSFREMPVNYIYNDKNSSTLQSDLNQFNKKGRLYSKDYTKEDGYMASIPEPYVYKYFEIDIASENSSYTVRRRGTNRLVVVYNGLKQYNSTAPIIFYTTNHYSSFKEFNNFAKVKEDSTSLKSFGKEFDGEGDGFGDYIKPETVSIINKTPLI